MDSILAGNVNYFVKTGTVETFMAEKVNDNVTEEKSLRIRQTFSNMQERKFFFNDLHNINIIVEGKRYFLDMKTLSHILTTCREEDNVVYVRS